MAARTAASSSSYVRPPMSIRRMRPSRPMVLDNKLILEALAIGLALAAWQLFRR